MKNKVSIWKVSRLSVGSAMILALPLGALFPLPGFPGISYADIASFILFFALALHVVFLRSITLDPFSFSYFLYIISGVIPIIVLGGSSTPVLNIVRVDLISIIIYLYIINSKNQSIFYLINHVYLVFFFALSFVTYNLYLNWAGGFSHVAKSEATKGINLNNIGFLALMIMMSSVILVSEYNRGRLLKLVAIWAGLVVLLSFSRGNIALLLLFFIFTARKIMTLCSAKQIPLLAVVVLSIAYGLSDIFIEGLNFLTRKSENLGESFINVRIFDNILSPIYGHFNDKEWYYFVFGGASVPAHSILSATMNMRGVLGVAALALMTIIVVIFYRDRSKIFGSPFIVTYFILLFNDLSTNASYYYPSIKYFAFLMLGVYALGVRKTRISV